MRDFHDAKVMANSLRQALSDQSVTVTHSQSLEFIAKAFGLDNWNILAAKIEAEKPADQLEPVAAGSVKTLYCSFCGKSQHDVQKLIAGPTVFICDACVGLCDNILLEGDVGRRLRTALAARGGADALAAAREAFRDFSDEKLADCQRSLADSLEHIEWGLREARRALDRKDGEPWRPDPYAASRGYRLPPLADQSRDQIEVRRAELDRRAAETRGDADLIAQVLLERGVGPAGSAPAS